MANPESGAPTAAVSRDKGNGDPAVLEILCPVKRLGGSNPSLGALLYVKQVRRKVYMWLCRF